MSEEGKTTGKKRVVCSAQKIKELLTIICSVYLVDKCPPLRYNMLTFNKEVLDMFHQDVSCNRHVSEASVRMIPMRILAGLRGVLVCRENLLPMILL